MSLFGFLKDQKLRPTWTYKVDGILWRVIPTDSRKIVGEVRSPAEKTTSFFCLNQTTGEVFWEGLNFGEPWWIGIEAIHKNVLLLHGFSTPDLPGHKGIIAVDVMTGETLWKNNNLTFVSAGESSVVASQESLEGRTLFDLEYRTGEPLRSLTDNDRMSRIREFSSAESGIELPVLLTDLSEYSLDKYYNGDAFVGNVEGIDLGDLIIFNFHEKGAESPEQRMHLRNTLKVLDKSSGTILYSTVLNGDSPAVVPESFFIQQQTLFFVREKHELTALRLPGPYGEK